MTPSLRGKLVCAQLIETLQTGGAENLAVQIANARAAAGDRSFLYVLSAERGELADRVDPAVTVRRLGSGAGADPAARQTSPARSCRATGASPAQVRDDGVQVVQSHLPGPNFWALLLAERGVCAVVATVHNTREFDYGDRDNSLRRRLAASGLPAHPAALRRDHRRERRGPGRLLAELGVSAAWPRRLEVVTNGVAVPAPLPPAARAAVRASARRPGRTFRIWSPRDD